MRLGGRLGRFVEERTLGKLFAAPCDVVLSDHDVVQPDLLFVSREREHLLSGGDAVRGAPDLVVEILSPATAGRDRGYKHALYARHGVAEYWLVDPADETIRIHRLQNGALVVAHTFGRGQTLRSPPLAGFELDLPTSSRPDREHRTVGERRRSCNLERDTPADVAGRRAVASDRSNHVG